MTKEEIEKAAKDYCRNLDIEQPYNRIYNSFISGAEFRQAEIEELVEAFKYIYSHWKDDSYNEKFILKLLKKYEK